MNWHSKRIVTGTTVGLALGGSIAIGAQFGIAVAAGVAVVPIMILVWPACVSQALGHLTSLARAFDITFLPWILLFLSGLVFRIRNSGSIQDAPLDAWALYRVVGVALAFLMITSFYLKGTYSFRSLYRGLPAILIAWGLIGAASTAWSAFPGWTLYKSLEYIVDVAVLVSIIWAVNTIEDFKRFLDWTWILLFGLLVSVWLGAVIWPEEALERGVGFLGVQLAGVFPAVAANGVGELAGLLGVVCLVRVIYSPHKVCYGVVFACCCATLILSQTRSALAGFVGGGLSILIASKRYFSAVIMLAAAALALSTSSADTFWKYIRRGQDTEMLANLSGRVDWWTVAIERIKERPLLGYGAYSGGKFVVLQQLGDLETSGIHNDYLEILLGTGVVGLSLVIVVLASVWSSVLRASQRPARSRRERAVSVEALAVLTLLMIRSIFSSPLFWHPPLPFLLIVGYAETVRQKERERCFALQYFPAVASGSSRLAEFQQ